MQKKIKKLIEVPVVEHKEGKIIYNLGSDMASADWMRYGRLMKEGKIKEAEAMAEQKGYKVLLENGKFL